MQCKDGWSLVLFFWALLGVGCTATSHPVEDGVQGVASSSDAMLAALADREAGPIRLSKHLAARWQVDRAGLINLEHPRAQQAGLTSGPEAIEIYFYELEHPRAGRFIIDSGIARGFLASDQPHDLGWVVRQAMQLGSLEIVLSTADWLERRDQLDGVFLTHIHLDHIFGLADVPSDTPVYVGPRENQARSFEYLFTRGSTNRLLGHVGALKEVQFTPDPQGMFAGVIDVFGDGSLWALHVPGHTPGGMAFVVRAEDDIHLILGDASHTAWGWRNEVEPGTFSLDQPRSAESLAALRALAAQLGEVRVHPGHQQLTSN